MAKVKYKKPTVGMNRMIITPDPTNRPSLGMTEVKGEIYYINPTEIIPYKNQARKEIPLESLEDLASSIRNQGIIQPLQVIPSQDKSGKFEVVSGERRLRAAIQIGLNTVPCMILDKERDADEIALIENIQRENLRPIELADAIAACLVEKGYNSQADFASRIGVSKQQISHLLAISRLPEDVKEYLLKRPEYSISSLRKLAYLKDETEIREKVFGSSQRDSNFRSILRLSFNGDMFRIDHSKIDKLSNQEKGLLKAELSKILLKLSEE